MAGSTIIPPTPQPAKKGGETNHYEISRNHRTRRRGIQPRRLRLEASTSVVDLVVARLLEVSFGLRGVSAFQARPPLVGGLAFLRWFATGLALTNSLPRKRNRHGKCAALEMPIRTSLSTSIGCAGARNPTLFPVQRSRLWSAPVTPRAMVSLPGPEHSARGCASFVCRCASRRRVISSAPRVGSIARKSTKPSALPPFASTTLQRVAEKLRASEEPTFTNCDRGSARRKETPKPSVTASRWHRRSRPGSGPCESFPAPTLPPLAPAEGSP